MLTTNLFSAMCKISLGSLKGLYYGYLLLICKQCLPYYVNYLDATQNSVTCVILLVPVSVHFVVSVYYCDCSELVIGGTSTIFLFAQFCCANKCMCVYGKVAKLVWIPQWKIMFVIAAVQQETRHWIGKDKPLPQLTSLCKSAISSTQWGALPYQRLQ